MNKNQIHLEKLSWENFTKVLKLRVNKDQRNFVATNNDSIIHAFLTSSEGIPTYAFAIYKNKTIIGFISLLYDNDWTGYEYKDWLESDEYKSYEGKYYYAIWRFMIDKKYQNNGYGRKAIELAMDFIKTLPAGNAEYMTISYEPKNTVAKQLYQSVGFKEYFNEYIKENDEITCLLKM